ncbi:PHA/PHB synthase family protein [Geodermatophilus sabuli]|uniref:Polyhydroxyalkanoate synthase n=1 Tax=Geodermatophilus sabuli TaxID=1564158 RepID=A0A285EF71_9ACTN|nr:alpha/beta fold hydrolase [Geodermatophilus sabuli]MBB3086698.1 polyhydroxyalkanoate synthase [Geodermatophilus sabuli]SNX97650.1 polyhydroxyalkanoate synthase [Geodermatophilus sabuli]
MSQAVHDRPLHSVPADGGEDVAAGATAGRLGGVAALLGRPQAIAAETVQLGRDLVEIVRGTDRITPSPRDRRFADPAWTDNPGYRRLGQGYLAWASALQRLVDRLEADGGDWRDVERARFTINALTSAAAPTNTLLGNPAALKRVLETGGGSVVRGAKALVDDVLHNGGLPSQTDRSAFQVGRNLGMTPGAVVYRDDVIELIQYSPSTERVRERPLLVVPPPIGRFYFLDLRPGRSFVEHAVAQGLQVFMISWRNPTRKQAHWDLDTYAERVRRAVAVARQVTGSPDVNTVGFCAGGIVMSTLLNHLAAVEDPSVHSATFGVTLLDFHAPAPIGAFAGRSTVGLARRLSRTRGVIPARSMGSVFTWMRPDDLVFGYLVNQWLMGEAPPAFDVLEWNADGTNLPAALHEDFLRVFRENTLTLPGEETVLGSPVDLGRITVPTYVVGALTDHITPWKGTYRTTHLLSGPTEFVLSSSGHIQSLVNPPGNPRMSYWTGGTPGPDPEEWRAQAERHTGSWWEHWAEWAVARSGDEVPAPQELGSEDHPAQEAAPGLYVLDRVPA